MKKITRIALCSLISSVILLQGVSCGKRPAGTSESGNGGKTEAYDLWSSYSTAKVGQNPDANGNFTALDAKLEVSMIKNETEGAQLIITAKKDVNSFALTGGELKSSNGEVFPLENVDIYQQKYIKVNNKTDFNGVYTIGEYVPDMLLPMSVAQNYKENSVKAGNNQGIYVEFDSKGVSDGEYTGYFTLDVDGEKTDIPVSVNVWDIEYEGRRSFKSCFVMYQSSLLRGEFDNSDEMVNEYIDFFLDYKINTCLHNKKRNDFNAYGEEWLESVVRTKDNLNYNSVYIPYQFPPSYVAYRGGSTTKETEVCLQYVTALAKISTPENCYVDYAYFYPFELDEADIDTVANRAANAERMLSEGGEVDQMLSLAADRLKADAEFLALGETYGQDFIEHVLESVLHIPTLFTNVNFMEEWVDNYSASFCPYLSVFGNGHISEHYASAAKKRNAEVWAYTCVGPTYPYPTFHIDDYNLGTRISGWMEKCYGIDGYLYWASTNGHNSDEWYKYVNQYEDATRYSGADGDGYLVYPGKYYGVNGPIPSLRLVAYRDSMDDYDMLCVYEELLKGYYEKYGLGELDFNAYVADIYASLFNAAIYNTDDSLLDAARKELAKRILAVKNEDGIMLCEDDASAKIYASASSVSINGKTVEGTKIGDDAYVFNVSETSGEITVTTAKSSATFALKRTAAIALSDENVTVSDNSSKSVSGGTVTAILRGKLFGAGIDDLQTASFTPNVSVKATNIGGARSVRAAVENSSAEAVSVFVRFVSDGKVYELGSAYLEAGQKRNLIFSLSEKASALGSGEFQFYIQNVVKDEFGGYTLQADKTLKLYEIRAEYARGN